MSDLDDVLERLVIDPGFRAALAADPDAALAGYRLSADDVALLRSQVAGGDTGQRRVETRTSKASLMGLFGGLAGGAEAGPGQPGFGHAGQPGAAGTGPGGAIGQAAARIGESVGAGGHFGEPGAVAGGGLSSMDQIAEQLGPVVGASVGGHGIGEAVLPAGGHGMGEAVPTGHGVGEALPPGTGTVYRGGGDQLATGYHPHVDADGDGRWDTYVAVRHADGGVDVYEDRNHDGIVDFVGHDRNADGIIDSADYDENFDGVADTHMTDLNGDGWLDTRTPIPPPQR